MMQRIGWKFHKSAFYSSLLIIMRDYITFSYSVILTNNSQSIVPSVFRRAGSLVAWRNSIFWSFAPKRNSEPNSCFGLQKLPTSETERGLWRDFFTAVQWRYLANLWLLSPAMWFSCPPFLTQKGQTLVTSVTRGARMSTFLGTCTVANWLEPLTSATKTVTRGSSMITITRSAGWVGSCSRSLHWSSRQWGVSAGSMKLTAVKVAPLSAGAVHSCILPLSRGPTLLFLQSRARLEMAWTWARANETTFLRPAT